jgi:enterochelin esterase family protein
MTRLGAVFALAIALQAAGTPAGHLDEQTYDSKVYGGPRRAWTYMPAAGNPAGIIVCLWGADYVDQIPVRAILDDLIAKRKIPPLAAVLVDDNDQRFQDFQATEKMAASVAGEVLPWARARLHVPADPRRTIVTGYSAAGLASTYVAFAHPDLVGNVLSQSGAFWRAFDGTGAAEPQWLAAQFDKAPKSATMFYLEVGGGETRVAGGVVSLLDANRHLRDVLVRKGYSIDYEEVPGAQHEFGHWRSKFGDGLVSLTSRWNPAR